MKNQVVIVAAGKGTRFKTTTPKPLILLSGKPVVIYCLEAFEECPLIESMIVVAPKDYLSQFQNVLEAHKCSKPVKIVEGGQRRRDSVWRGLKALDQDTDFVVIHDGVRPFVTSKMIENVLLGAHQGNAAITAVPVKSTIKTIHSNSLVVEKTLKRDTLWEVQTPQVFKREIILQAHENIKDPDPPDDSVLVEKLGLNVKVVFGDYKNIKLTTDDDLIFAEALLTLQGSPT